MLKNIVYPDRRTTIGMRREQQVDARLSALEARARALELALILLGMALFIVLLALVF